MKKEKQTLFKKENEMKKQLLPNCHHGKGEIRWTEILTQKETPTEKIRFIHYDILPAKTSVGIHHHSNNEEYYYILSGKGIMTLNDKEFEIKKGDITAVYPRSSHSLKNPYDQDLDILVICIN